VPTVRHVGQAEGGVGVQQHAERQEGLDRHRIEPGGRGHGLPELAETDADRVTDLGFARGRRRDPL